MRRSLLVLGFCIALSADGAAQLAVYDPAVTARNAATAVVKEFLLNTEREQHNQLRRMAQRLSMFTSLMKYRLPDPPRWRTHGGDFLFTQAYNDALIFGDPTGAAYLAVSHPVGEAQAVLSRLTPAARRAITTRLYARLFDRLYPLAWQSRACRGWPSGLPAFGMSTRRTGNG